MGEVSIESLVLRWQREQQEFFSPTVVEIVSEYARWREAEAASIISALVAVVEDALPILEGIADEIGTDLGAAVQEGGRISAEEHKAMHEAANRAMNARNALAQATGNSLSDGVGR